MIEEVQQLVKLKRTSNMITGSDMLITHANSTEVRATIDLGKLLRELNLPSVPCEIPVNKQLHGIQNIGLKADEVNPLVWERDALTPKDLWRPVQPNKQLEKIAMYLTQYIVWTLILERDNQQLKKMMFDYNSASWRSSPSTARYHQMLMQFNGVRQTELASALDPPVRFAAHQSAQKAIDVGGGDDVDDADDNDTQAKVKKHKTKFEKGNRQILEVFNPLERDAIQTVFLSAGNQAFTRVQVEHLARLFTDAELTPDFRVPVSVKHINAQLRWFHRGMGRGLDYQDVLWPGEYKTHQRSLDLHKGLYLMYKPKVTCKPATDLTYYLVFRFLKPLTVETLKEAVEYVVVCKSAFAYNGDKLKTLVEYACEHYGEELEREPPNWRKYTPKRDDPVIKHFCLRGGRHYRDVDFYLPQCDRNGRGYM